MNHRRDFTLAALEERTLLASLSGVIWSDIDRSQTIDRGEGFFEGWTVFLDDNANGRIDPGERTTVTDRNGAYSFTGLPAGTYNIAVAAPSDYGQTSPGRFGSIEGSFDIQLRFNSDVSPEVRAVFEEAAARWKSVIIGDLPSFTTRNGEVIDDLRIDITTDRIDGPGGVLAYAGPDDMRPGSYLPATGSMNFDPPDIEAEMAKGEFLETVIHEMGHVLGIGTLWPRLGLLDRAGSRDPRFTGRAATAAYERLFQTRDGRGVPVEADGGDGTALGHWDESRFTSELMTGFANYRVEDPLSIITVASLQDIGYTVNMKAADTWNPFNNTVRRTTPLDLGATMFQRRVTVSQRDVKRNLNFGYRTNRPPKLLTLTVPSRAAIGQNITLSASNILDPDGDPIAAVSFYRESNGVPGLQKGEDFFIGSKTVGKRGAFSIETSTAGLIPGEQVYYAVATDTQLTSGRRAATVSLVTMPDRPAAPAVVSGVSISGSVAIVNWTDSAINEEGYRIQVATRPDFASDALVREFKVGPDVTSLRVTGLAPGKRYYYRVRAFNIGGSSSYTMTPSVLQLGATEILIDNTQATFTGSWATSTSGTGYLGTDYRVNTNGRGTARFDFEAVRERDYALYVRWPASESNAKSLTLTVITGDNDAKTIVIDQSNISRGGGWVYVGDFKLRQGAGAVVFNARGANGAAIVDAIRFI